MREVKVWFGENQKKILPTATQSIQERQQLLNLEKSITKTEIKNGNKILEEHFRDTDDICKVVHTLYTMERTFQERLRVIKNCFKNKSKEENDENRRIR